MAGKSQHTDVASELFDRFRSQLSGPDRLSLLADDLIGRNAEILGPFGAKQLVYADYTASGRALGAVEKFVQESVLPFYANVHTEGSYCGSHTGALRAAARKTIAEACGADERHSVIFAGSGATAGLNRLIDLFGVRNAVAKGQTPRIIIGPYEHHSNILPWRESGAEVVEIGEAALGGPELALLDAALAEARGRLVICAFSAASNVTGIVADVAALTRRMKAAGAKVIWDYAGGGPYLPISMEPEKGAIIDAIAISPHKFIGGPGSSGVLIVRKEAVVATRPTWPGGGTVQFVSPVGHDYVSSIEGREEAGTPNVIGDIRAGLSFAVKDAIGLDTIVTRNALLNERALSAWRSHPRIELLGNLDAERLPIFSFRIRDGRGGYVHHQLITRMLSDRFGIQARGGCACAGPYVHRLIDIDEAASEDLRKAIANGEEMLKPGFTRLNFSVLMSDEKAAYVIESLISLANDATEWEIHYSVDERRAVFSPKVGSKVSGAAA
jgi:selenocysteine lyase/cysteine desulfurase